jgi:hypothetical protein
LTTRSPSSQSPSSRSSSSHRKQNQTSPFLRGLAGLFAGLSSLWVIGMLALFLIPKAYLPWTPLDPNRPLDMWTRGKFERFKSDPVACRAFLTQAKVRFTEAPSRTDGNFCTVADAVRLTGGGPPLSPNQPVMTCPVAAGMVLWHRHSLQPLARDLVKSELKSITHFGTYACRTMRGNGSGAPSEHARANAIDIAAFSFANGTRIALPRDWNANPGQDAVAPDFLLRAQEGACDVFRVVLGPRANAAHADHFHFDMGPYRACR